MLNFSRLHISIIKIALVLLIVLAIVGGGFVFLKPSEELVQAKEQAVESLNFQLINDISDFEGSQFIEKEANNFLRQWNLAGMSMSIVKDGKLVYAHGFGFADVEVKQPVEPGNLFRIASVSKLITAVAVMKLVDKKLVSLDSKVFGPDAILKDSVFNSVKDKRLYKITVRNLLAHSGGWSLSYGDPAFNSLVVMQRIGETGAATLDSYCKFIATRKLHFEPGSRSSYSNMGYMFLSKVIETVSGKTYEDFVNDEILKPVGITDMHIGRSYLEDRRVNEVKYYEAEECQMIPAFDGSGKLVPKPYGGNPIELLGSAGGWIASSIELAKLLALVDGFKNLPDILSHNLINQMTVNEKTKGPLGWKVVKNNGDWIRTGSMAGTSAIVKRQADGFCWVIIINSSSWKGPRLPAYVNHMMGKIQKKNLSWPKADLFKYGSKK
jgi:CubicO group peptidase (beta-lactamase class C family)